MTGFNLGCVDEINTFDLKDITLIDGKQSSLRSNKIIFYEFGKCLF